ncbi:hypothetical protein AB0N93_11445 [Streptomyces sp. NPDC091267]|uniref:hypothetical protein n=1 Tax=Streptomyces sp. NPDC091267 TaxID=3155195 RepID=UPI0034196871
MPPTPPPPATPPEHPAPPPSPQGRTRHGLALGLAAASVVPAVVLGGPTTASAAPQRSPAAAQASVPTRATVSAPVAVTADQQPSCGDPEAAEFPIDTRIHGGPDTYASGGGYGTWFLDLTNTTSRSCRSIHPVLVLTDDDRKLTSNQIQLQFSERAHPGVEHRVIWETTDRDEHIGVFGGEGDESFGGFTVPAGRTVTVQVRLAFTSDTTPGRITANAAIVQRQHPPAGRTERGGAPKGSDGEWVGESEDYPFSVVEDSEAEDSGDEGVDSDATGKESDGTAEVGGVGEGREGRETPGTGRESAGTGKERDRLPDGTRPGTGDSNSPSTGPSTGTGTTGTPRPVAPGLDPAGIPELASTGIPVPVPFTGLTVAGFLIGGGAVLVRARRTRRARA